MSNWRLEEKQGIAILHLDVAGKTGNILSNHVAQELDKILAGLETKALQGLIIRSNKVKDFILGADVYEFQTIVTSARAAELTRASQMVLTRLEALPFPSVALIHGNCLGGGLELALACSYRIAREDEIAASLAHTRLGLPEVKLGIHPGFGGSVRLPALIGHLPALDLMLTGRTVNARQARRLGLVDEIAPERHMLAAARAFLTRRPPKQRAPWWKRLPGWTPLRPYVKRWLRWQLRKKVNPDHYPAPYRLLDLWARAAGMEAEAVSCAELLISRTSRNLIYLFSLSEELKRVGRKQSAAPIEWVHVIGAGRMGADIALWAAYNGFNVSLQDQRPEVVAQAIKKAHDFFSKNFKSPRLVQAAMDRLMPEVQGNGLRRADLVIEAIAENVQAKSALFRDIEPRLRPDALLATNTSSIPLETLARSLRDPSRLVGLHFFNPATKMQLVEIVRGAETGEKALARARAFTVMLRRLPLNVRSSPGFLVNRVLMPYLIEAIMIAEEEVPVALIDRAATDFGMPVGPILLADTIGLDICLSVAEIMAAPLAVPVPDKLRAMVGRGEIGKKTGKGFYTYKDGRPLIETSMVRQTSNPVTERLILRLLNEAMACLREGVVADPDAIDVGLVYGIGFAPFHGGPMRYAKNLGSSEVLQSLKRLAQTYGSRFEPDAGWYKTELLARRAS